MYVYIYNISMFQTTEFWIKSTRPGHSNGGKSILTLLVMFLPVIAGEKCWELLVFCPAVKKVIAGVAMR
jgi:hypothetical protein